MKRKAERRTAIYCFCCAHVNAHRCMRSEHVFFLRISLRTPSIFIFANTAAASCIFVLVYISESRCRALFAEKRSHVLEAHFYQNQNRGFAFTARHSTRIQHVHASIPLRSAWKRAHTHKHTYSHTRAANEQWKHDTKREKNCVCTQQRVGIHTPYSTISSGVFILAFAIRFFFSTILLLSVQHVHMSACMSRACVYL